MKKAFDALSKDDQDVLQRAKDQVEHFATVQRANISNTETKVKGGMAGQDVSAVDVAGCYAPGMY